MNLKTIMKSFRAQAATEYLMTYGWALLIIIVVAAVLFSLGIFKPSTGTTDIGFSPFTPSGVTCIPPGGAGTHDLAGLYLSFANTANGPINITGITLNSTTGLSSANGKVCTASSISAVQTATNCYPLIYPGQNFVVYYNVTCLGGSSYSAAVTITYSNNGVPGAASGHIAGTAV
jgi:hypothetical protein